MENGLLFYLSGEHGTQPDIAHGIAEPNFLRSVETIDDGVHGGKALRCLPDQLLAYWAPGNIYSQRGTLSFFWRSRTALGETEFPLFRVAFADHSSWDALFIRIDYNGHGIDAFATDINLSRVRVSAAFEQLPRPDEWFHICFTWDETEGVALYINGKQAAKKQCNTIFYAGLDQFGTHSRIISNAQVQSSYNYMRTGDFDELRIYDRALSSDEIMHLVNCESLTLSSSVKRTLEKPQWREEWEKRYGFDYPVLPAPLSHRYTCVEKVEIHDAWDLKRWWWKSCDGIRETTWPGVYNRSRLPGRTDYFILPDWDCYSLSGKEITFEPMKDRYWNHMEISGSAHGRLHIHGRLEEQCCIRRESSERSVLRLPEPMRNVSITFTNDEIEEPIGDITLLNVVPGVAPAGCKREVFIFGADDGREAAGLAEIRRFIRGRYLPDERTILVSGSKAAALVNGLPIVHLMMPYVEDPSVGLDGVELHLPALDAKPTHDGYILVNVQIKDPLWIYRNLLQFTFAVLPQQEKTLWLNARDRILPPGKALYMTLSFSAVPASLNGLQTELIYKPYEVAKEEHVSDRWIQVKDNYAHLVEENPSNEHFNLFNRFKADLTDLLRVCPEHRLGREYWYDKFKTNPPSYALPECPKGIPAWAWLQTQYMGYVKRYLRWWIDKRQIGNGEFGGGLSDDGDLTAWWPGPALTGCMPEKIRESLLREMEAFYDQGMFANGLCAIQTDQLHTLEDGIQALGQCLTLDPTSPKHLERAMENARGLFFITGINAAGHRHLKSGYYSGTRIATEPAWAYSASDSFHVFTPSYLLVRYNGSPKIKQLILETADSMLAHYDGKRLKVQINVLTDEAQVHERTREWHLFYAAWHFTGDPKYLAPIQDHDLYATQQERLGNDPQAVVTERYAELLRAAALREYINTDGQLWVDRGVIDIEQMQKDRIGGVGHIRFALYPRHYFRWHFKPSQETDVGILTTYASNTRIRLTAFNMIDEPVEATMTMEDVLPGQWLMRQGISDTFDQMDAQSEEVTEVNRFSGFKVVFAPGKYTTMEMELSVPAQSAYWSRTDLAITREDVLIREDCVRVRVHNIGAVESSMTTMVLRAPDGQVLRRSNIPPIEAPIDLYPKVMEIPLWTRGIALQGCTIELDPEHLLDEITRENNVVQL